MKKGLMTIKEYEEDTDSLDKALLRVNFPKDRPSYMTEKSVDSSDWLATEMRNKHEAANSRCSDSAGSEFSFLFLVCEIREAVGDPEGRLMQDELVAHCKTMRLIGDMMARMLETTPNAPTEGWPDDQDFMETVAAWRKLFQNAED